MVFLRKLARETSTGYHQTAPVNSTPAAPSPENYTHRPIHFSPLSSPFFSPCNNPPAWFFPFHSQLRSPPTNKTTPQSCRRARTPATRPIITNPLPQHKHKASISKTHNSNTTTTQTYIHTRIHINAVNNFILTYDLNHSIDGKLTLIQQFLCSFSRAA